MSLFNGGPENGPWSKVGLTVAGILIAAITTSGFGWVWNIDRRVHQQETEIENLEKSIAQLRIQVADRVRLYEFNREHDIMTRELDILADDIKALERSVLPYGGP